MHLVDIIQPGLQEPIHHKDAATKFYTDNSMVILKADKSYVDQKVSQASGNINLSHYLKRDGSVKMIYDLDLNNNFNDNLKPAQSGH